MLPGSAPSTPNGIGNAFVADRDHGQAPGAAGPELTVRWLNAQTVELSHHIKARVSKAETVVDDVRIVYNTWP